MVYKLTKKGWETPFDGESLRGIKPSFDLVNASSGDVVVEVGRKITPRLIRKLEEDGLKTLLVTQEELDWPLFVSRYRQRQNR